MELNTFDKKCAALNHAYQNAKNPEFKALWELKLRQLIDSEREQDKKRKIIMDPIATEEWNAYVREMYLRNREQHELWNNSTSQYKSLEEYATTNAQFLVENYLK